MSSDTDRCDQAKPDYAIHRSGATNAHLRNACLLVLVAATGGLLLGACMLHHGDSTPKLNSHRNNIRQSSLQNVLPAIDGLLSGSQPHTDADFDELVAMGIRTIVCVDGGRPDVLRARERGIRYVHLPIGYDGIAPSRQLELARAVRDLPKPIYLHCHHGKHRGPAAAAVAAVVLGKLTNKRASQFLIRAGTSPSYTGLLACVRDARPLGRNSLDKASADFPEVAQVRGLAKVMGELDRIWDRIEVTRNAGWRAPETHPDLLAANEASALLALFSDLRSDRSVAGQPGAFREFLADATEETKKLQAAIHSENFVDAEARFAAVAQLCKQCHVQFRNEVRSHKRQPDGFGRTAKRTQIRYADTSSCSPPCEVELPDVSVAVTKDVVVC